MVIKIVANIKKVLFDFAFINIIDDYQKYKIDSFMHKESINRFKMKCCFNKEPYNKRFFNEHNFVFLLISYTVNIFLLSVKHTNTILPLLSMTT